MGAIERCEEQRALIDRMLGARTGSEVEAAERAADEWLKDNPRGVRVMAAHERLDERGERARDPEREINRKTLAVFAAVFSSVAFAGVVLTGSVYAALAAGFLLALPTAEFVWGLLYDRSNDGQHQETERGR